MPQTTESKESSEKPVVSKYTRSVVLERGRETALRLALIILCVSFVFYLIADYNNIPSRWGFVSSNLNYSLLGIAITFFAAVLIFLLTYWAVYYRNIKQQENQRAIAFYLIKQTYDECKYYYRLLFNKGALIYLVKKVDFSEPLIESAPVNRFIEAPFQNEDLILKYASNGIIPKEQMKMYFEVKRIFTTRIYASVLFHDEPDKFAPDEDTFYKAIDYAASKLGPDLDEILHSDRG